MPTRRLQFGLRRLLLLIIAASVVFAFLGKRISDRNAQRALVAAIERLEGQAVSLSQWDPDTENVKATLAPRAGWLGKWIDEISVDPIVAVTYNLNQFFSGPGVYPVRIHFAEESLSQLKELPQLQYLYLPGTAVKNETLVHLARLPRLSVLDLSDTGITDAGLVHLQTLTNLKGLDISRTQITSAGAARLCRALPNTAIVHQSHPMLARLRDESIGTGLELSTDWTQQDEGDNLVYRMEIDKARLCEGETVRMTLTVANVDRRPITYQVPQLPNTQLGPLRSWWLIKSGQRVQPADRPAAPPSFVRLAPGEAHSYRFAVGQADDVPALTQLHYEYDGPDHPPSAYLRAGHYSIQFQYFGYCFGSAPGAAERNTLLQQKDSWSGSFTTRPLEIEVLPDLNEK